MIQGNYWDTLPEELHELILVFKKHIESVILIQRHYRKVRWSPSEMPRFCSKASQRAIVQWYSSKEFPGDGGWIIADVLKFNKNNYIEHREPPGREIWKDLVTARLRWTYTRRWNTSSGEIRTDNYYRKILWFDPKDRPRWATSGYDYIYANKNNTIVPARVVLIKKW